MFSNLLNITRSTIILQKFTLNFVESEGWGEFPTLEVVENCYQKSKSVRPHSFPKPCSKVSYKDFLATIASNILFKVIYSPSYHVTEGIPWAVSICSFPGIHKIISLI